jgi:hypothetical protein
MNLKKVKIADINFAHAKYTTDFQVSQHIEWVRNELPMKGEILFLTDNMLPNYKNYDGIKIGMLMEPRAINPSIYEWVKMNHYNFYKIFTYDKELIESCNNVEFYPHCGCWIKNEDQKIYEKNSLVSIVASSKSQTGGHRLRHDIISLAQKNNIKLDVFGRGYNPVDYKLEALDKYAFSIVIENSKVDYYFTEKLMDSFITGTVPIYWGCPSIGDFFNLDGMIIFDNVDTLLIKLNDLSLEKYQAMLPAIHDNFNRAKKYLIAEDWLYNNTEIFK